jgi:hypothetical protein
VIALIVAVAVPVLVSTSGCDVLLPTVADPKLRVEVEALSVAEPEPLADVPVPLAATVVGELVASLATENVADNAPAVCGVKLTVTVSLPPAGIVVEFEMPEYEKLLEAPVTPTPLMIAVPVPVLLMVTCWEEVLPTCTEPKVNVLGDALSVAEAARPVLPPPTVAFAAPVVPQPASIIQASVTANRTSNRFELRILPSFETRCKASLRVHEELPITGSGIKH